MAHCAYCGQPATMRIVSNPDRVCFAHALEFWNGLMAYAVDRSDPCVKDEGMCTCSACDELSASRRTAFAIASAGPCPGDHEDLSMRLAS
jgi:hypothetical protein